MNRQHLIPTLLPACHWLRRNQSLVGTAALAGCVVLLSIVLLYLDVLRQRERDGRLSESAARLAADAGTSRARIAIEQVVDRASGDIDLQSAIHDALRIDLLRPAVDFYHGLGSRRLGRDTRRLAVCVAILHGPAASIPYFDEAIALLIARTEIDPDDADTKLELTRAWNGMGEACRRADRKPQALAAFRAALALIGESPSRVELRLELARAEIGDEEAATVARGISRLEESIHQEPSRLLHRAEAIRGRINLARIHRRTRDFAAAESEIQRASQELEALAKRHPANPVFRERSAILQRELAELHRLAGRNDQSLATQLHAAEIIEQLANEFPDVDAFQRDWVVSVLNLSLTLRDARPGEDEPLLRRALTVWRKRRGQHASPADHALTESWIHWRLGDSLRRRGKAIGATVEFRYALHSAEQGLNLDDRDSRFSLQLSRLAAWLELGNDELARTSAMEMSRSATPTQLASLAAVCSAAAEHLEITRREPVVSLAIDLLKRIPEPERRAAIRDTEFDVLRQQPEFRVHFGRSD